MQHVAGWRYGVGLIVNHNYEVRKNVYKDTTSLCRCRTSVNTTLESLVCNLLHDIINIGEVSHQYQTLTCRKYSGLRIHIGNVCRAKKCSCHINSPCAVLTTNFLPNLFMLSKIPNIRFGIHVSYLNLRLLIQRS